MDRLPPQARRRFEEAREVARTLRRAGYEALFCGGAVRDLQLGREPKDVDVATSATPEEGVRLFPEAVEVGARFGVLVVPRPAGHVEVATFRADGRYVDGRRPTDVSWSDPKTDASRRDFTINGLFQDPESGEVVDFVGGLADIDARLVRAIGDAEARFTEDRLRILRAVRFALQLDFAIEPATFAAVRRMASRVGEVAVERTREELFHCLYWGRGRALRLLHRTGLLAVLLPDIEVMRGVPQPARWHPEGDVFVHTALVLDGLQLPPEPMGEAEGDEARQVWRRDVEALLWSALLHDVAKPTTFEREAGGRIRFFGHDARGAATSREILEHLRLPRRTIDRVETLVAQHMRIAASPSMRPARLRRFLADPDLDLHLRLHAADCGASHGGLDVWQFLQTERERLAGETVLPPPLLDGHALKALGYREGPLIGRALAWLEEEQLEGRLASRESAVQAVLDRFPPDPGGRPLDASL